MTVRTMSSERFVDNVFEGYSSADFRYCFVLGAGASRTSGIRTGEMLMKEWYKELWEKGLPNIQERIEDLCFQNPDGDYFRFLNKDYELKSEDYFDVFDLRFCTHTEVGNAVLIKEFENKFPSYGYYPLSILMSQTDNNLAITTNFDSLIEDALFMYTARRPLAVGHESLAHFITPENNRPVIAKVHRDMFLNPLNRKKEMNALHDGWKIPLQMVLGNYIPIIIGYAGGDHTFMSLLEDDKVLCPKGLYWCYVGEEPNERIKAMVARHKGWIVKIKGFDEIMFLLAWRFGNAIKFEEPFEMMSSLTKERYQQYEETRTTAMERLQSDNRDATSFLDVKNPSAARVDKTFDTVKGAYFENIISQHSNKISREPGNSNHYYSRGLAYHSMKRYEEALQDENRAIALEADNATYYNARGVTLHEMRRYEDALQDKNRAIELEPDTARYYNSRGITLNAMRRYEDALQDKNRAVELEPNNARYYDSRSITLHSMERYEDALEDCDKVIELEPDNARYYDSRSVTLHSMERYEDALKDCDKAIALEPDTARYYDSRSITLHSMERYKDALKDCDKAIELEPDTARYYDSRGTTLHSMERYKDALKDCDKAIELEPDNASYYDSRSTTLHRMNRYEDALKDKNRAIELEPDNARYYDSRGVTLHEMRRYEDALQDCNKAIELEPGNEDYIAHRNMVLNKSNLSGEVLLA